MKRLLSVGLLAASLACADGLITIGNGTITGSDPSRMFYTGSSAQDLVLDDLGPNGAPLELLSLSYLYEFLDKNGVPYEALRIGYDLGGVEFDLFGPMAEPSFFGYDADGNLTGAPFPCSAATCVSHVGNLGSITWADGTVDKVRFSHNPEPASIMLLGGVFLVLACLKRRMI